MDGLLPGSPTIDHISVAGLDSTVVEPLPEDSPLWAMSNVIITPHVGPGTEGLGALLVDYWGENICRFAEDDPLLGIVDRHLAY